MFLNMSAIAPTPHPQKNSGRFYTSGENGSAVLGSGVDWVDEGIFLFMKGVGESFFQHPKNV